MADNTKTRRASIDLSNFTVAIYGAPDEGGKQAVVQTLSIDPTSWPDAIKSQLLVVGAFQIVQNAYKTLDEPSAADVAEAITKTLATFADGSWHPGRTVAIGEQPDIVVALAEYYNVPVHVIAEDIENRLVRDAEGNPVRDARGRNKRVFTKAVLDHIATEPAIRPILARLAKERADRLSREARGHKGEAPSNKLDLFSNFKRDDTVTGSTESNSAAAA